MTLTTLNSDHERRPVDNVAFSGATDITKALRYLLAR